MRRSIESVLSDPAAKVTRQTRAHLATLWLTAAYSRLADRVAFNQLAAVARIAGDREGRHTRRALRELHELGALIWHPGGRGQGRWSWVGLPGSDLGGPLVAPLTGQLSLETRATGGPPTEKVREDPRHLRIIDDCNRCGRQRCAVDFHTLACDDCREVA
jgi:hypothetical protein